MTLASWRRRDVGDRPLHLPTSLVELTAITLGFGALLLDGSYRRADDVVGHRFFPPPPIARRPASLLASSELAYLLAVQLVVRGHSAQSARPLLAPLSREHAEQVDRALRRLAGQRRALTERLGLTPPDEPPRPPPAPAPLPDIRVTIEDVERARWEKEDRAPAYRRRATHSGRGAFVGGLAGLPFVSYLGGMGFYAPLVTAVVGASVSHRLPRCVCSNCGWDVARSAPSCWRCERPLVSDVEYWGET